MLRLAPLIILLAAAWMPDWPGAALSQTQPTTAFQPKRGIGLAEPFAVIIRSTIDRSPQAPYYLQWDTVRNHKVAEDIKANGFDHVRLVIDTDGLLAPSDSERQQVYQNIDVAIRDILGIGLNVVFDIHPGVTWNHDVLTQSVTDQKFKHYVDVVKSVGQFVSGYDQHRVAIELFNEPPGLCRWKNRPQWSEFQKVAYAAVRATAPKHTIILTGPCWSMVESLQYIDPRDYDANTIFTIHFYEPSVFVWQGAAWVYGAEKYIERLPYPPLSDRSEEFVAAVQQKLVTAKDISDSDKVRLLASARRDLSDYFGKPMNRDWLKQRLSIATDWADKNMISRQRLWVGEFGAMRDAYGIKTAAADDRLRWLQDVTSLFDEAGISWSVWAVTGFTGLIVGDKVGPLDQRTMAALGLGRDNLR